MDKIELQNDDRIIMEDVFEMSNDKEESILKPHNNNGLVSDVQKAARDGHDVLSDYIELSSDKLLDALIPKK